jgi:hypothetical protein
VTEQWVVALFGKLGGFGTAQGNCTSADAHRGACGGEGGAPENDLSAMTSVRLASTLT